MTYDKAETHRRPGLSLTLSLCYIPMFHLVTHRQSRIHCSPESNKMTFFLMAHLGFGGFEATSPGGLT